MANLSTFQLSVELSCQCTCSCSPSSKKQRKNACHCCASIMESQMHSTNGKNDQESGRSFFATAKVDTMQRRGESGDLSPRVRFIGLFVPQKLVQSFHSEVIQEVSIEEEKSREKGGRLSKTGSRKKQQQKRGTGMGSEKMVGVDDKLEQELNSVTLSCGSQHSCGCCRWTDAKGPLSSLLVKVHPSLSQTHFRGIFMTQNAPGDILLLDLGEHSNVTGTNSYLQMSKIIEEVSGEGMVMSPSSIIKAFLVTNIFFRRPSIPRNPEHYPEVPSCAVCLHRIDPIRLGLPPPKSYHLCSSYCGIRSDDGTHDSSNRCSNMKFLSPWPLPSYCVTCHVIKEHSNKLSMLSPKAQPAVLAKEEDFLQDYSVSSRSLTDTPIITSRSICCYQCGMKETLWVCLTCGVIGCGRYSQGHADKHYQESGHPFSLELATQRIWEYAADVFAQRQDLLKCPLFRRASPPNRGGLNASAEHVGSLLSNSNGTIGSFDKHDMTAQHKHGTNSERCDHPPSNTSTSCHADCAMDDSSTPKKAAMIGDEYEALLQSALEDQAQHFEGEISRLRAELTAQQVSAEEISEPDAGIIEALQTDIADMRKETDHLSRQLVDVQAREAGYRATSQHLLRGQGNAKAQLDTIRQESEREHEEGKMHMQSLEEQVSDLTTNLRMMQQISQNRELSEAHIYGTNSGKTKRSGKKARRSHRR